MLPKLLLALLATSVLAAPAVHTVEKRTNDDIDERDLTVDARNSPIELDDRGTVLHVKRQNYHKHEGWGQPLGGRSCPGSPVSSSPISFANGRATIHLYYSRADEGTNCAYVVNETGEPKYMYVRLYNPDNADNDYSWDAGFQYKEYAGSVRVSHMSGHCIGLEAHFDGDTWFSPQTGFHCGR